MLLFLVCFVLFLIPNLFWGNLYLVGGDDTRLYYLFPHEFFNFSFKMTSDNAFGFLGGYYPKTSYTTLFLLISLLKMIPHINVQFLFYGLNLSFGFLSFYAFLGLWLPNKSSFNFFAKIVSSLFYILSTYLLNTFYTNQILSLSIVSAMPATLYFFFKSVLEKKIVYTVLSVLIISFFTVKLESTPWSFALLICLIPLFFVVFWNNKKRFITHGSVFIISFILLNMFWLAHLFYPLLPGNKADSNINFYSSSNDSALAYMIKQGTGIFGATNSLFNERNSALILHVTPLVLLKGIFIIVIVLAGIFLQKTTKIERKYYLVSLGCFLLAVFLFQPKMGGWGDDVFLFFNAHVPLFSMFRNMYDKFSFALAFMYAFVFYISLIILVKQIKRKELIALLLVIPTVLVIANASQFLFPTYQDNKFSFRISGVLNDDFSNLVDTIKNTHSTSRYLWLPFNYPSYIYVEDKYNKNHFYYGLSVLPMLADTSDYAGYLSFGSIVDPNLGKQIVDLIAQRKYDEVGHLFQILNVKYIIYNKQEIPDEGKAFLYSANMLEIQDKNFRNAILGEKIKDFGQRYSLYTINKKYDNEKIYLTQKDKKTTIKFNRRSDMEYDVWIDNLSTKNKLILQDLYNKNWDIFLIGGDKAVIYKNKSGVPANKNFANAWDISSQEIKDKFSKTFYSENKDGSINIHIKLYFDQLRIVAPADMISFISYIGLVGYVLVLFIKQKI